MNIIIVGGGASAVLCAIEASKNPNNNITIIDANNKLLKKLLVSGNGKCNFTNLDFKDNTQITKKDMLDYYNNDFYYKSYKAFTNTDLIDYFYKLGMPISIFNKYDKNYVYPLTKNSRTLYYLLLDSLNKNNININTNEIVLSFAKENNHFIVNTNNDNYYADILVIATGGKSYYENNNVDRIYNSLNKAGIKINKLLPALSPLLLEDNLFNKNTKFRFEANVCLYINKQLISQEFGEIQINNNQISGIPILNLSSKAIKALDNNNDVKININFLYSYIHYRYNLNNKNEDLQQFSKTILLEYFNNQKQINKNLSIKQVLSYIIDTQMLDIFIDSIKLTNIRIAELTDEQIVSIIDCLINYELKIIGHTGFKTAQLTQGGVSIEEIDEMTFESKKIANLYFTGEIIDVDGICGGYNLQFAFGSGYIVGKNLYDKN